MWGGLFWVVGFGFVLVFFRDFQTCKSVVGLLLLPNHVCSCIFNLFRRAIMFRYVTIRTGT